MAWFRRNEHDEEQLSAYLDGELDSRQAEKVETHLATCDACRTLLEELRSTRTLLSSLPAEAPRRSFVLGAEHARRPVRDTAPARRLNLAFAPAVALSVFVALILVDVAGFAGGSDESADTFTAATSRQAQEAESGAGAASAPPPVESLSSMEAADATPSHEDDAQPDAANAASGAAASGEAADAERRSAGPEETPNDGEAAIAAEPRSEEPSPEPLAFDSPGSGDDDGISMLRALQFLAAAAFLASGLYVFVWPRLTRGGS